MMNESQRTNYLAAMQIQRWLPRTPLPFAAASYSSEEIAQVPTPTEEVKVTAAPIVKTELTKPILEAKHTTTTSEQAKPTVVSPRANTNITTQQTPHFSLQLMQAGSCLLLIELATGQPLQIRDPAYQLLRNILKAAQLPDSPQLLGDVIHWPLFKQVTIPQGEKEAQEFLESYLSTYQEQLADHKCLWLVGLSAVRYVAGLNEQHYCQTPILESIGQTLLTPSLELLIEQPHYKAVLWQSIRQLIPLWQA